MGVELVAPLPAPKPTSSIYSRDYKITFGLDSVMSKLETPMTRWYWQQVGGTLIEDCAVPRSKSCGTRLWTASLSRAANFGLLGNPKWPSKAKT